MRTQCMLQRAFSCLQFKCDISIKDFQNYNSSIDFSLKIIITLLDFHPDVFKLDPVNRNHHLPLDMYLLANLLFLLMALSSLRQLLHPSNHIAAIPIPVGWLLPHFPFFHFQQTNVAQPSLLHKEAISQETGLPSFLHLQGSSFLNEKTARFDPDYRIQTLQSLFQTLTTLPPSFPTNPEHFPSSFIHGIPASHHVPFPLM